MTEAKDLSAFRAEIASAGSVVRAMEHWIARLEEVDAVDPAIWIQRFSRDALLASAAELDARGNEGLPLFGLPFAVKDNIDVSGLPTTAACPDYSYQPVDDAPVVALLRKAGAICVGKTNLDQFATGLVGTRSPYGIPRNSWRSDLIPGGSSSGSAVAVARGLVAFSLGTDTAGSGRVPAALNGICGWKPTKGLLSTRGVVPACRSLDCVSIFAAAAKDIAALLEIVGVFDPLDPFSRSPGKAVSVRRGGISHVAIPLPGEMEFFGDELQREAWTKAVDSLQEEGFEIREMECRAFFEAARLLYEGPWVAERYNATRELLDKNPGAFHPVTRAIVSAGAQPSAWQAFAAMERLAVLRRESEKIWEWADALCLPTIGSIYTLSQLLEEPVQLNSNLGYYTNFMNLLDLAGVAVPAGQRADGLPFGLTFVAPAWCDHQLLRMAQGSRDSASGESKDLRGMEIGVFGAHMRGLPLSSQLEEMGGEFLREDRTAPSYRMVALDHLRPGVFRAGGGGQSIELEVWRLPVEAVGRLLAGIPAPLGLGKILLLDGREICGFLCEECAVRGKEDISAHGGWRAFKGL